MLLSAYLTATQRLLQNPVPATPLYDTTALTSYINEGRRQIAGDGECVRATASATLTPSGQVYPFSLFATFTRPSVATGYIRFSVNPSPGDTVTFNGVVFTFVAGAPGANEVQIQGSVEFTVFQLQLVLQASASPSITVATYFAYTAGPVQLQVTYNTIGTAGNSYTLAASAATRSGPTLTGGVTNISGISSVLTIRQLSVNTTGAVYKMLANRPWPWFNRYNLANGQSNTATVPNTWSQQAPGIQGVFGIAPPPDQGYAVQADVVCMPADLVSDSTYDAIPSPFDEAVPYYAAYKAYLSSQRTQDATVMLGRYKEFLKRAIDMSQPTVFPVNFQGGRGAQITSAKQSLTMQPQPQQGGGA